MLILCHQLELEAENNLFILVILVISFPIMKPAYICYSMMDSKTDTICIFMCQRKVLCWFFPKYEMALLVPK